MIEIPRSIILFTGTRGAPESIRKLGLLAGGLDRNGVQDPQTQKYVVNKERTLQRVLKEFGLKKEDVPVWTYSGELEYEQGELIHLHFCLNFEAAAGYSWMGGEVAYCIRRHIMEWQVLKTFGENDLSLISNKEKESISREAAFANGPKQYVIVVKIDLDDQRLDKRAVEQIKRFYDVSEVYSIPVKKLMGETSFEVRYYGDIPVDKILGIVQVKGFSGIGGHVGV